MGVRQERENKRKPGYTTQSLRRVCLWLSVLSAAAKITRQELSPKVLLIAGKSHLVPQWESILRPEAPLSHFNSFWNVHFDRHLQARLSWFSTNALTHLCFITVAVISSVVTLKVRFTDWIKAKDVILNSKKNKTWQAGWCESNSTV